jgi:hypothetical protein
VRRAVHCLSTLRPTKSGGYSARVVTGEKTTHVVHATRNGSEWSLMVRDQRDKSLAPLRVKGSGGAVSATEGRPRDYRAPVLVRSIHMLLTAREASEAEVEAILRGLPEKRSSPRKHSHDDDVRLLTNHYKISLPPG